MNVYRNEIIYFVQIRLITVSPINMLSVVKVVDH